MKKLILLASAVFAISCTQPASEETVQAPDVPAPSIDLPYTAGFSSQWTHDVSDQDLATVLNSYKTWENGNMSGLRNTLADSVEFYSWDGDHFTGASDELMKRWSGFRDSLSSVEIKMDAWMKNHSVNQQRDFVSVWYTEIDIYKNGKIDSAYFQDDNEVKNGKIVWYSQHKQLFHKR
jgi:hypothetical protein